MFDHTNGGKKAADAKKAEVETDASRGTVVDPVRGRKLFADFADREWAPAQDWKDSTRERWPFRLKRLTWALGEHVRLRDVDSLALQRVRTKLATRYTHGTVQGDMHLLRAIIQVAHAVGAVPRDPTIGMVAAPKRRQDDRTERVTPDMVPTRALALELLAGAPPPWRAAIALGLAGLRIGEVLGMRRDRLALEDRRVTIDAQAMELTGKRTGLSTVKNDKVRTIVVPQPVATELRRHLRDGHSGVWVDGEPSDDERDAHEMLFVRPDGELWRQNAFYNHAWAPTLAAAGLPERRYKFHSLRHHCASTLLAEGCPLPVVAGYLGDHQQTIMRVYAHWMPDDEGVPAAILDRMLAPTRPDASQMPHGQTAEARR